MSKLIKVPEAAELLCVSQKKVWAMVGAREIDVVRIGRSVRVPMHAVERLIEQGMTPALVR